MFADRRKATRGQDGVAAARGDQHLQSEDPQEQRRRQHQRIGTAQHDADGKQSKDEAGQGQAPEDVAGQ